LNTLRKAYHTIRFWVLITVLSIVLGLVAIFAGLVDRSGRTSHRVSSLWSRLLCQLNGVHVTIDGMEHVDRHRAQIFVANHQGYFDIFTLSGYLPVQICWVAKASLFRVPFVGWSMKAAGYVPVDRSDKKKAYRAFLASIERIKLGSSIVIFPEGTRSEDGTIGPFKKGGHLLALRAEVPMVPVTIIGSGKIIRKGSASIQPGPVHIIISPPIDVGKITSEKEETLLENLRNTICRNYEARATKL
jgi:1-acyl-sn-glycerol-3-phosphate acyltransferase